MINKRSGLLTPRIISTSLLFFIFILLHLVVFVSILVLLLIIFDSIIYVARRKISEEMQERSTCRLTFLPPPSIPQPLQAVKFFPPLSPLSPSPPLPSPLPSLSSPLPLPFLSSPQPPHPKQHLIVKELTVLSSLVNKYLLLYFILF